MTCEVLSELKRVRHARVLGAFCECEQHFLDHGSAVAEIDGVVVNSFTAGDFFGEIAFVATAASLRGEGPADLKVRRTANVVARERCRCLELKVKDLFAVYGQDAEGLGALLGCVRMLVFPGTHSQHAFRVSTATVRPPPWGLSCDAWGRMVE